MDNTRELMEVNLRYIKENIAELKEISKGVLNTLQEHEKILLRNTITVEDHKRRSDLSDARHEEFLKTQLKMIETLQDLSNRFSEGELEVSRKISDIERDLAPIKTHVQTVGKFMTFLVMLDENKWTIAKILGFIIAVCLTIYMGEHNLGSFLK